MRLEYGSKLGAWEVKELLGKGGQARVYRAVKVTVDEQIHEAAIKAIVVDDKTENYELDLLAHEHDLLSTIDSPYVAKELDSGVEIVGKRPNGTRVYWFAMERINGQNLHNEVLQNGPLDYLEWLHLAHDLTMAISEIHGKGIVHSDIKPANVIRSSRKSVLVDFGGSTLAGIKTIGDYGSTTLRYSSPEKLENAGVETSIGYESDIFSAGQLLVFAATGQAAWDTDAAYSSVANTRETQAVAEKLTKSDYLEKLMTAPPRLTGLNFAQKKIVSLMLSINPAMRPDAQSLVREIKGLLPATSSRKTSAKVSKPMRWVPQRRGPDPGTALQQGLFSLLGWIVTLAMGALLFSFGFLFRYVTMSDQRLYLLSSRRTEYRFVTAGVVFTTFGLMGLYLGKNYSDLSGKLFHKIMGWLGLAVFAMSVFIVFVSVNQADAFWYQTTLEVSFLILLIYSLSWGAIPKEKLAVDWF